MIPKARFTLRCALTILLGALPCTPALAQPPGAKAAAAKYACPMKCEGDKTYAAEGKCPICQMNLKAVAASQYSLTLASAGGPPKGNEATLYNLSVVDAAGAAVKDFEPVDGKKLHVYIVLRDLMGFVHLCPDQNESGAFRFEQSLAPGEYMIYADFTPRGGTAQVISTSLSVSGKPANQRAMGVDADRPRSVDGCTVTLTGFKDARAGKESTLKFHVARDGKEADDPETYLGKPAHAVLLSQSRRNLVHAALVSGKGPDVSFTAKFPEPGLYRVWFQFQRAGKLSTVAFNFEVAEADAK